MYSYKTEIFGGIQLCWAFKDYCLVTKHLVAYVKVTSWGSLWFQFKKDVFQ